MFSRTSAALKLDRSVRQHCIISRMCHSDVGSKLIFQIAVAHNEISHSGVGTVVVFK